MTEPGPGSGPGSGLGGSGPGPWIIEPPFEMRWRWRDAARTEVEEQRREILVCSGCGRSVYTWPGEYDDRHRLMLPHRPSCPYRP